MAKSLVRNRHAVTKMYQLKSQLQAVSLRIAVRMLADACQRRALVSTGCRRCASTADELPADVFAVLPLDCTTTHVIFPPVGRLPKEQAGRLTTYDDTRCRAGLRLPRVPSTLAMLA